MTARRRTECEQKQQLTTLIGQVPYSKARFRKAFDYLNFLTQADLKFVLSWTMD